MKHEVLFHADLAVILCLIVHTSVLLIMKCNLGRTLLIQSLIFIQNTKLLLCFLVHIFSSLTCNEVCWHASSSAMRAHVLSHCFSLPLASPQSQHVPTLPMTVVSLPPPGPSLPGCGPLPEIKLSSAPFFTAARQMIVTALAMHLLQRGFSPPET